ncbi:MAG: hypothetical protein L0H84_23505, partial [Pseudonocardia sp.]|nr:hypothetical protein [Pseudonocardia sp.]
MLDDLHWADRDTLDLLAYLCAGAAPVPLVLAARDDERGPAGLDSIGRYAGRLPLVRLDDVHVAVLAAERAGGPVDPEAVAYLCAASGGLPLLVADLTAGLLESGGLRCDGGMWRSDGPLRARVPGAFTRLVAGRVRGLAEPVRALVRAAALLGDELDWRFVATATGDVDPAAGLRAAVEAGLFRTGDPDALQWRHALTREAVLDELTPPERAELTRRIATRLKDASLTGAQLAVAAQLCALAGDRPRAAGLLLDLGREHLAAGALVAASDVLTSAAAVVDDGTEQAAEIAVERLRVLGLRAMTDEALALGEQVLPSLRVDGAARVRLQLARACVAAERWDDAARYLDTAGRAGDAERLALDAHIALGRLDVDGALRLAADAIAAGHREGAPEAVCEALEITGRVLRASDAPASRAAFIEGARLAAEHGLVPWRVRALAELATHDVYGAGDLGRLREARRLATEAGMPGTAIIMDLQLIAAGTSTDGHVAALPLARRCADAAARLHLPGPAAHALIFVARGQFWGGDT